MVFILLIFIYFGCSQREEAEKLYYALEKSGVAMGYTVSTIYPGNEESGKPKKIKMELVARQTLLGESIDIYANETWQHDPVTDQVLHIDAQMTMGTTKIPVTLKFDGNVMRFTTLSGEPLTMTLEDDVYRAESHLYAQLVQDFGRGNLKKKNYRLLDYVRGKILEREFTLGGEEKINLNGIEYDCLLFTMKDLTYGVNARFWIERKRGSMVMTHTADDTKIYLTDPGIKNRIQRADLNEQIFASVDLNIKDIPAISYMKVRAKIRSVGEVISPENLTIPGQTFAGTVEDNLVEGVFEVEHKRYHGQNAPPFPPDFSENEELKPYLEPEWLIEANDPVLVKKAKELTEGAEDCWEASRRLAEWVGTEIKGALPGGSARQTYNTRKGECGAHSRLFTAFCRGVGIPARMVMGGVYTDLYDGTFGQHGWNEVYMGEAGWIPVDTTFQEFDFVDSGHIRLGYLTSFMPLEMEVLDYRVGTRD